MKKFGKVVAVMMTAVMLLSGCGGSTGKTTGTSAENGTSSGLPAKVVVGTNAEFPPFEYMDDNGQPDGFDMALIKEVGKRAGFEVEIKNMDFDALLMSMSTGGIDMVIAGMTATEEKEKQVDFSDPYFDAKQVIIVKQDNNEIKTFDDLSGKKVAVQQGTTGDLSVTEGDPTCVVNGVDVKRMNKGADAVVDLINGGVDAVVIDLLPAKEFVEAHPDDIKIVEDNAVVEHYAIAMPKGSDELKKAVNDALASIKEDGTLDQLKEQYDATETVNK